MPGYKRKRSKFARGRMASSKARRSYKGKSSSIRKKRKTGPSTLTLRSPLVVADRLSSRFRYTALINFAPAGAATAFNQFRANSLFDPDQTAALGSQPYGVDQWSPMYQYYRVLGSSIEVNACIGTPAANSTAGNFIIAVYPHNNITNAPASMEQSQERPYATWKIGTNNQKVHIKKYMSTAKIYGDTKTCIMSDDNYTSIFSTNPVNQWNWTVIVQAADQASGTQNIQCWVTLVYYAILSDRSQVNTS